MTGTVLWANNAVATLAGSISSSQTTITLSSGLGALYPSPGVGQFFPVTLISAANPNTREITYCTSRSGDVLTVVRAQEGTTGLAFNANDIASLDPTAATLPASGFATNAATVSSSTSITAAYDNNIITVGGSATTQTLAATGWAAGNAVGFFAAAACTVAIAGGGTFRGGLLTGKTSALMQAGSWLCAQFDGTNWVIFSASLGALVPAPTFGSTWVRYNEDGTIEQGGVTPNYNAEGAQNVTFPVAFPTDCLDVQATLVIPADSTAQDQFAQIVGTWSQTTVRLYCQQVSNNTYPVTIRWRAIGY